MNDTPLNPHKSFKRSASFAAKRLQQLLTENDEAFRPDDDEGEPVATEAE